MPDKAEDYTKYLDPKTLAKIASLDLRARLVVEGFVSGKHRSPYHGFSVEFAEHRQYVQGDDLRHLDWKVFGRTDKLYIKQYEEETNLCLNLLVDTSESMNYRSDAGHMSKYEYGVTVAASLAYLALQQADSVGLALFDEQVGRYMSPSNNPGHWKTLVQALGEAVGPRKTSIRGVFNDLAERLSRRSLMVLISDCFDDVEEILRGLQYLRYKRHEIIVFQILDHAEREFPFQAPTLFEGLEQAGELLTEPRALRRRYLQELEAFTTRLRRGCRDMHMDYELFDTASPLDVVLSAYLANRAARIK